MWDHVFHFVGTSDIMNIKEKRVKKLNNCPKNSLNGINDLLTSYKKIKKLDSPPVYTGN